MVLSDLPYLFIFFDQLLEPFRRAARFMLRVVEVIDLFLD